MARGTQLIQLVTMLRDELARSSSVAVGAGDVDELKQKIRRQQELLYDEYDWPHLQKMFDQIPLQAGERFYDLPSDLNLERISDDEYTPGVVVWFSGLPTKIRRGIGFGEYSIYNSQNDTPATPIRSSPVQKWDIRFTGTKEQIEVWPIPNDNTMTLQIYGMTKLAPLIKDSDVAVLDDQAIVLSVAAEILAKQGAQNAQVVGKKSELRVAKMFGRMQAAGKTRRMGMGKPPDLSRVAVTVRAR